MGPDPTDPAEDLLGDDFGTNNLPLGSISYGMITKKLLDLIDDNYEVIISGHAHVLYRWRGALRVISSGGPKEPQSNTGLSL